MKLQKWRSQHPLDGVHNKLNRAKKHLETLDEYLLKYRELNPHRMIRTLNVEEGVYEYVFSSTFPPFIDFGLVISEYVYHLRSALDQMIFGLAEFPANLTDEEWEKAQKRTSFPISEMPRVGLIKGRIMTIPPAIRDAVHATIESVQPYMTSPEAPDRQVLAILERLSNGDKHRSPQVTGNHLKINTAGLPPGIVVFPQSSVSDGDLLAHVAVGLNPQLDFEPRVSFEVHLAVPGRLSRHILIEDLPSIHNFVRNEVVPKFEPFFPPIPTPEFDPEPGV